MLDVRWCNLPLCFRMQLVVQPVNDSVLEQLNKFSAPSSHLHTHTRSHPHILDDVGMMEGEWRDGTPEPSPFSTKKDMYSGKGGTQVHICIYTKHCVHWELAKQWTDVSC